jgi:hypothetical protein
MVPKKLIPWFMLIAVCNSFLWLDSLDQYLASRFHIYLTQYIPENVLIPSQKLKNLLGLEKNSSPEFTRLQTLTPSQENAILETKPTQSMTSAIIKNEDKNDGQTAQDAAQFAFVKSPSPTATTSDSNKSPYASLPLKTSPTKIMFAGDSMMQGIAPIAMSSLKKIYPKSISVDLSQQSTGLTVKRYFDWPTKIKEGITKENYKVIVLFLGPNDPWDIYENKKVYKFPSNEWEELYRQRVEDLLKFAKNHGAQIIWVGLPNMGEERLRTGAIIQNRVFKGETQKYNYQYVSTEEMIGRLDQPYKAYIKDPIKGDLLMRGSDGIHFTPTALRLISQSVVQAVQQLDQE